jgi:hypothetical protein
MSSPPHPMCITQFIAFTNTDQHQHGPTSTPRLKVQPICALRVRTGCPLHVWYSSRRHPHLVRPRLTGTCAAITHAGSCFLSRWKLGAVRFDFRVCCLSCFVSFCISNGWLEICSSDAIWLHSCVSLGEVSLFIS